MKQKPPAESLLASLAFPSDYLGRAVVPCCFDKDAKHRMGDLK
jgi:hypothetical protein